MASLFSRLFAPQPNIVEPVKASMGGAWASYLVNPTIASLSRNPNKLMAEAEALFHSNPWIGAAERAISGRAGRVGYHLEDENGDTLDPTTPLNASLISLIEAPKLRQTRRQLWSLTARHMGLAGNAFWYLDQRDLLAGTPLQILYINPARMTAADDDAGNLIGWILSLIHI